VHRAPTVEIADALLQRLNYSEIGKVFLRYLRRAHFVKQKDHAAIRKYRAISLLPETDSALLFCLQQAGAFCSMPGTSVGFDVICPVRLLKLSKTKQQVARSFIY